MDHVHKKSHLLNLHGTCHIPNLGVCLISLDQLLNHGAKVQGDMHQINMLYGDGILLAPFTPGHLGSNMYTLESLPLKELTMTCMLTYDIVHCHLGHPSKDVIRHAHKHMWNFPDVEILTWTPSALAAPWANYPTGVSLLLSVALQTHSSLSTQTLSLSPLSHTIVIDTLSPLWMTTHQWHGLHLCALKMLHWLQPATS